jgi:N-acylglucosamine-6-phosphate 2-epimerase
VNQVLEVLRGGLIVSVQAPTSSALDDPYVLAAMARAAQDAGAVAVRMQGIANLRAARKRVTVPIVGIVKRDCAGFEPYITPALTDVNAILETGCEVVAFDATRRARPDGSTTAQLVAAIHAGGAIAMADCAAASDGPEAIAAGADIVATTLCGYTNETARTSLPALDLVCAFAALGGFTICEGGIASPQAGQAAIASGADAIVVGAAITGLGRLVGEFREALANRPIS